MNIILGSVASSIFDIDALRYIQAVEIADNQALEGSVKTAINTLVVGLKTDGIWSDISACGILAGARTLNGALVPLKGPAPTNYNFVAGDYTRLGGLSGDALTKYIDTNELTQSRPLTSSHISIFMTKPIAGGSGVRYAAGTMNVPSTSGHDYFAVNFSTAASANIQMGIRRPQLVFGAFTFANSNNPGFKGSSRSTNNFTNNRSNSLELTSGLGANLNIRFESQFLFAARGNTSPFAPTAFSDVGLTFYSIGSATNLQRLDNRVTTFMQTLSTLV